MKVRLSDIAKRLNISSTAVSLAINNKPGVSENTRRKVIDMCNNIGYKLPNMAEYPDRNENIKLCIYKKHGLVVSNTPFFSAVLEGIGLEAEKKNINVMYTYLSEKVNSREEICDILQHVDAGGMIVLATEMDEEDVKLMENCNVPLVILDAYFEHMKIDSVLIDNIEATKEIVEYLISCQHTKIGYLKSRIRINNFKEREAGLLQTLQKHGIKYEKKFEFEVGSTPETAYADFFELLNKESELPTAFFADNDIIALGAMRALKEFNLNVPEDISIVGFDGLPNSGLVSPSLTTVRVRGKDMGRFAVERLVGKIENDLFAYVTTRLGTDIVLGQSVSKPKTK